MITNTATQQQQPAVIYARVSCEEQVERYSIQAKLRIGRRALLADPCFAICWSPSRLSGPQARTAAANCVYQVESDYAERLTVRPEVSNYFATGNLAETAIPHPLLGRRR